MGVPKSVQPNHIIPIFLENQFFVFFDPPKPYMASETSLFDLSNGFRLIDFKIAIFGHISPGYPQNCGLDQKVLEV